MGKRWPHCYYWSGHALVSDGLQRPSLIAAVNGQLIGPGAPNLRGDHPHKANIAAQPDHLVVDGKPLLRAEARDVLDRLIDVICDGLRRPIAPGQCYGPAADHTWSARALMMSVPTT